MPIFEFHCGKCGADSEILVRSSKWAGTPCPKCGSKRLKKKLSVFASAGGGDASEATLLQRKSAVVRHVRHRPAALTLSRRRSRPAWRRDATSPAPTNPACASPVPPRKAPPVATAMTLAPIARAQRMSSGVSPITRTSSPRNVRPICSIAALRAPRRQSGRDAHHRRQNRQTEISPKD